MTKLWLSIPGVGRRFVGEQKTGLILQPFAGLIIDMVVRKLCCIDDAFVQESFGRETERLGLFFDKLDVAEIRQDYESPALQMGQEFALRIINRGGEIEISHQYQGLHVAIGVLAKRLWNDLDRPAA